MNATGEIVPCYPGSPSPKVGLGLKSDKLISKRVVPQLGHQGTVRAPLVHYWYCLIPLLWYSIFQYCFSLPSGGKKRKVDTRGVTPDMSFLNSSVDTDEWASVLNNLHIVDGVFKLKKGNFSLGSRRSYRLYTDWLNCN